MYTLSIPGEIFTVATLAGVVGLFSNEHVKSTETALIGLSGGEIDAQVTRYNGRLAIRCTGNAAEIVGVLFDQVRTFWTGEYGSDPRPWQIRPAHWDELFGLFDLARAPERFLSSSQIEAERTAARNARRFFDLSSLFDHAAAERFGFGAGGPPAIGGGANGRHEVHVAYALLRNEPVPETVLDDYRAMDRAFRYDLEWAMPLLNVPELRGRLPAEKQRWVASVMRGAKQAITAENVDAIVAALGNVPNQCDFVDVDDALFAAGVLSVEPLPAMFSESVALGTPVNAFAARLRQILADSKRDRSLDHADLERTQGRTTARRHKLEREMAVLSHGRETFEWANRVATAIDRRELALLLEVLDTPDDRNRSSKRAVDEHYGVKLRGIRAQDRRRAIFALCGMDVSAQGVWEAAESERKAAARKAADEQYAKQAAQRAQYQRPDGVVIDGAQHVEDAIASGFREIRDWRKGAIKQYALVNAELGKARTLRAKDGTLEYARAMIERLAA
ncbi:hypothetical protein SAMN05443245_7465 [Paraburkholderia fungorum]|uniref:Uncharacterized protein n=1 Tax=Paraburkholderia fungorum TaxID=134537 RepID=A0A1H1JY70_9BURK|nr:hypothetical protein [Paraburkholderia fungorum]SDR54605.1 hypothetical protein SAMN05443245_7465 [Paraburkholderia fungorum]